MTGIDPKRYSGFIDADRLDVLARGAADLKRRSHALMQLEPGHRALDVGCGPGIDTLALAEHVGPQGEVIGVDYDADMIAEADARAQQAGVEAWVTHVHADAGALPLPDGHVHACRSDRVFQHLPDPERALAEMIRVTRRGGWIVVADPDQGTMSIDTPELDIERRLARVRAEVLFHNGFSGRRLRGQLLRHGLQDVAVEPYPLVVTDYGMLRQVDVFDRLEQVAVDFGVITEDELRRWHESLQRAEDEERFFAVGLYVVVAGRKP
ncbi:MAG: methyltransferase domain-containing protein [Myxococcales bacterium]|nr:methyltransferase domain-containing protein [Myxococcales bacterium]